MNGIAWLLNPPKVIPRQGRVVKLIDLKPSEPTGRPTTGHKDYNFNRDYYLKNKADILAKRKQYRADNKLKVLDQKRLHRIEHREKLRADDAKRRAAKKAAREHAGVLRDCDGIRPVQPEGE